MQPNYQDPTPRVPGRPHLAPAMRLLGLSNRELRKLLGDRATDSAIRHWKHGRRTTPQWAIAILDNALARDIAERQAERRRLAIVPNYRPGSAAAAWRQRRAAQKEKARS